MSDAETKFAEIEQIITARFGWESDAQKQDGEYVMRLIQVADRLNELEAKKANFEREYPDHLARVAELEAEIAELRERLAVPNG